MKTVIALLITMLFSSCTINVWPKEFKAAEELCASNNGVFKLRVHLFLPSDVDCNNGARFTLPTSVYTEVPQSTE